MEKIAAFDQSPSLDEFSAIGGRSHLLQFRKGCGDTLRHKVHFDHKVPLVAMFQLN